MEANSFADAVDSARRQAFVGRRAEIAGYLAALAGRSARRVLFVHGPGGIGKSTLLLEMRARARNAGRVTLLLDGRELEPSPEALTAALTTGDARDGAVLLIDGYEQLAPIDGWLRREFVPSLPARAVVVLAGRDPPAPAWRTDPGWRPVVAVHPLGHLDDADSAELLARAGVAPADRERLARLGRGHPLALALLADVARTGTVPETLAEVPDLINVLLESLSRDAPSDAHTVGLATCAMAWLTTEDLLRETVGDAAPDVWEWLCRRPFVVSRPTGLSPHDLTRDVLDAEFERRFPARYRSLHRTIHDHVLAGIRATGGMDRQLLAQHLAYLHRRSPLTAAYHLLRASGSAAVTPARPEEHGQLVAMAERAFGATSAALAARWFAEVPEHLHVTRTEDGAVALVYHVFCPSGSALEQQDPVVRAMLDHVARTAPTRPGERVEIARFLAGLHERQRDPHAVLAGSVTSIINWSTGAPAWSFLTVSDTGYWAPFFDYLGFRPLVTVEVDGQRHVGYGHDWRRFPPDRWWELMAERGHSGGTGPPPDSALLPPPLDRDAFAAAVRAALARLGRPERLVGNPLLGTVLGREPAALRASLLAAVDRLGAEPRGERLRAVLIRTFVRPAPSQEAAADLLGLPFSTYRRHLARGIDAVTELLWAVEIGTIRDPRTGAD
ncbi:ATP-binding protein [Micromonospora humi]|uniref:AAA ATPase domain-containing protein n=1 Tax=Micromonospora humi TaxID=745366 RepID=A0A1C5JC68_9ACTN|nr:ATP-binding protein [Micromonospora humi]SCG68123.1 AAA ATPase domain-containing protein [Micromonospora humi]